MKKSQSRPVECICDTDAAFLQSERPPYEALHPQLNVVDLFAGCGALTLGVAEAARRFGLGIDVVFAVDNDPDAVAVFMANFPGAEVRCARVEELFDGECGTKLTSSERRLRRTIGKVDVLVGGPPCQGHSNLNIHTRRNDPRNALYARMARAAEVLMPSLVFIENVPTVTHDVEKVVDATAQALTDEGYSVWEEIVDILRLGAPQRRRRHVMIASRAHGVEVGNPMCSLKQRCSLHPARSVRWAIGDLVKVKQTGLFDTASIPNARNSERIKWLFEHRAYDLPNELRPECHQSDHSYISMYGRLRWDEPAQTVTTGFCSMGQGRYIHPGRRRTITPHEAARLQMLPDFWDFGAVEKRGALARLIGNAVPPNLAQAILLPAFVSLGFEPENEFLEHAEAGQVRSRAASSASSENKRVGRRPGTPEPSSVEAKTRMQSTRQHDTAAELALRQAADGLNLKYETNALVPGTRCRADLLFREEGVTVFVDGCFWHLCPIHGTYPKANARWWREKLEANRQRDKDNDKRLYEKGWIVLRFWEHEDPDQCARHIAMVVSERKVNRTHARKVK